MSMHANIFSVNQQEICEYKGLNYKCVNTYPNVPKALPNALTLEHIKLPQLFQRYCYSMHLP